MCPCWLCISGCTNPTWTKLYQSLMTRSEYLIVIQGRLAVCISGMANVNADQHQIEALRQYLKTLKYVALAQSFFECCITLRSLGISLFAKFQALKMLLWRAFLSAAGLFTAIATALPQSQANEGVVAIPSPKAQNASVNASPQNIYIWVPRLWKLYSALHPTNVSWFRWK